MSNLLRYVVVEDKNLGPATQEELSVEYIKLSRRGLGKFFKRKSIKILKLKKN